MRRPPLARLGLVFFTAALGACSAPPKHWIEEHPALLGPRVVAQEPSAEAVRSLPLYCARSGRAADWNDLRRALAWADIIIVGEQHDDAVGHAFQRAVVEDVASLGEAFALSVEMLERHEQTLADDFVDRLIDNHAFWESTGSTGWGGSEEVWNQWYLPIYAAARDGGGRIIAANAPRQYVRTANRRGYELLRGLPPERRNLFDLPGELWRNPYRDRFRKVMFGDENDPDGLNATEARVDQGYRSQLVWDTTMAASIVRAYEEGRRVVHLIGQFHSDFEGGTVREIRRRAAQAKVLNISMQREWPGDLLDEDRGRADFVVYTGERPPEPEEDENEPTIEEGTLPGEEPPSSSPEDAPGAEQGAAPSGSAEPPGAAET